MLPALLGALRVGRVGPGRPRTTPDALLGDKAYSSRATRAALRARGITAVIAEPADQAGHRKRRGSKGGRPPAFDPVRYKDRNVVERSYQAIKQWRALATRYDKLALTYRAGLAHPRRRPMATRIRRHALGGVRACPATSLIEPLWDQFAALIPPRVDTHPLGCHPPPDRGPGCVRQAAPGAGAGGELRQGR